MTKQDEVVGCSITAVLQERNMTKQQSRYVSIPGNPFILSKDFPNFADFHQIWKNFKHFVAREMHLDSRTLDVTR